jgi:hypothetical protein
MKGSIANYVVRVWFYRTRIVDQGERAIASDVRCVNLKIPHLPK